MRLPLLAAMSILTLISEAVPAKLGLVLNLQQPDGSVVQLSLYGDEHRHIYVTEDGLSVIGTPQGYFYAEVDSTGRPVRSAMLAHNHPDRSPSERMMLRDIDQEAVRDAVLNSPSLPKHIAPDAPSPNSPVFPSLGLVLLVEYADVHFSVNDPHGYFRGMLNQEGFSQYNATGSARDYFIANSHGLYEPVFDVYGPVTLPYPRRYYGGNSDYGCDQRPEYMMLHAAQALDAEVDFSKYDLDGDGYVDSVFIFYAGESEAAGGGADTVWPHSWSHRFSDVFDGVRLCDYSCSSELISSWMPDGIGTFCHEFCHVLGLPDLYNTDDGTATYTPMAWSVMDQGCYSNDGRTPAGMSAFERNSLGWMDSFIHKPDHGGRYSLEPLSDGGAALLLTTERDSEYFVIENRQLTAWDTYLPYHGMLVWHIDYSAAEWLSNRPNNHEHHQRIDIVEASGRPYGTYSGLKRYPFPGVCNVTSLRYGGTPSLEDWQGRDTGYIFTDIAESGGIITFDLSGEAGIADISAPGESLTVEGRRLRAHGHRVTVADICGREVASGTDVDISVDAPGIYIICIDGKPYKVVVD